MDKDRKLNVHKKTLNLRYCDRVVFSSLVGNCLSALAYMVQNLLSEESH